MLAILSAKNRNERSCRNCICLNALTLASRVIEAMRRARIEVNFDIAPAGFALFHQFAAASRRYFLVGGALKHLDRRVR
jgi:hypothetical protein